MSHSKLELALKNAQARVRIAIEALAQNYKGAEQEEYWAAQTELLHAERALAAEKGEQYAVPIDFPLQWDTGAPLPHVLSSEHRTFLIFYMRVTDPHWDGTYVTIREPSAPDLESLGVVEFKHCTSFKLGAPNDEVLEGHPLNEKGLESYSAQRVLNSKWIAELQSINSVHSCYNPESWKQRNHYVLWFHDSTFECVANSFDARSVKSNLQKLLPQLCTAILNDSFSIKDLT